MVASHPLDLAFPDLLDSDLETKVGTGLPGAGWLDPCPRAPAALLLAAGGSGEPRPWKPCTPAQLAPWSDRDRAALGAALAARNAAEQDRRAALSQLEAALASLTQARDAAAGAASDADLAKHQRCDQRCLAVHSLCPGRYAASLRRAGLMAGPLTRASSPVPGHARAASTHGSLACVHVGGRGRGCD